MKGRCRGLREAVQGAAERARRWEWSGPELAPGARATLLKVVTLLGQLDDLAPCRPLAIRVILVEAAAVQAAV